MRNSLLQFSVAIVVGLTLLLAGGNTPWTASAQSDVAAINKVLEGYAEGVNNGDLELWISLWDEKGIQMPPDTPARIGKAQIRAIVANVFQQFNRKISITNEETWVFGNLAFARGTYSSSRTPKAGGPTGSIDGKYLTVYKKQPDGSWKIFRDIFNSNVPPQ